MAEAAAFFVVSLALVFLLLEQVNGKFIRLRQFLLNREFQIITSEKAVLVVNGFLKVITIFFIMLPVISLIIWAAGLIVLRTS